MPTSPMNEVIRYLRSTLVPEGPSLTDGQLLECFVSRGEPAALEALVRRHAPMVWAVCRRVLGNHHDAEDAFQAAFLVLVRKAATIRANVGNWLYGVAHQTALKARATRSRRRQRERPVTLMPEPAARQQDLWNDLVPLLDQEVSRLPEKYRTVIVLCELEGQTLRAAAHQLGCPEGTVASRLARARAMLARRLVRYGFAITGGTLAAALSQAPASACVPAGVLSSTIKAVTLVAAGKAATGLISAQAALLTEAVMKAMLMSRLKSALGACLIAALFLLGSVFGSGSPATNGSRAAASEKKSAADKAAVRLCDDKLRDTLLVLDKQWWDAASSYDVDSLARLVADDYISFSPGGDHATKKTVLERCRLGRYIDVKFPTGKTVIRLNEHTAIVTYEVLWDAEDKGKGRRGVVCHDRMISCWVRRDGGWFLRYHECVNRYNFPDRRVPAEKPLYVSGNGRVLAQYLGHTTLEGWGARQAKKDNDFRVFPLGKDTKAEEVAKTIEQLFNTCGQPKTVHIAVYASKNTVVVRGKSSDLDSVEAIITRLVEQKPFGAAGRK
jgi:RNA polymerase sigma factor (sigma-70 family)